MSRDILVQEGLFKGLCGIVRVALRVEGFGRGMQPPAEGGEFKLDEDNEYLAHSLDRRLQIKVPVNGIVWDENHAKINGGNVHTLVAKGDTIVSYCGKVLSVRRNIHLAYLGHETIWCLYSLLLQWYLSGKIPEDLKGPKKDMWYSLGEMTLDDPDYCLGEMIASESPMITQTLVKHFPRESKRALEYYIECKDK